MSSDRFQELADLHGLELEGEATSEGDARRVAAVTETGDAALLYVWEEELLASRAAEVHRTVGAQLFAVPEHIASGPGWLLVRRPDGVAATEFFEDALGREFALTNERGIALAESLGNVLRKMHSLPTIAACGDFLEDAGEGPSRWLAFSGWVAHHLEWFSEDLRRRDFADETVEQLSKSIADMRHELSSFHPRTPPSVVHGKVSFRHVWVDRSGREIVGLTGFDRASYLPREADIAYLLWIEGFGAHDRLTRAFYQGYGAARTMDVQRRERFYRRLVAFEALFGFLGEVQRTPRELIELTGPV